jgi:hypothetical protein
MDFASVCLISLNAYHRIFPDSFFRRILEAKELEHVRNSLVFHGFSRLAGLAKERKDYFIILKIIEQDVDGIYEMLRTGRIEIFGAIIEKLRWEIESELLVKFERFFIEEEKKI